MENGTTLVLTLDRASAGCGNMKSRALYIRDVSTNYQFYRIGTLFVAEDGTQTVAWRMMDIPDEDQAHLPLDATIAQLVPESSSRTEWVRNQEDE